MNKSIWVNSCTILLLIGYMVSCASNLSEEKSVMTYCGGCHLPPDPISLPPEIWEKNIFPEMSKYYAWDKISTYDYANIPFYNKKGRIAMTDDIWTVLLDYYHSGSEKRETLYETEILDIQPYYDELELTDICNTPTITAMHVNDNGVIYSASKSNLTKYEYRSDATTFKYDITGDITDILVSGDTVRLLDAGIMGPHVGSLGSLKIWGDKKENIELEQLMRPVYITDIDNRWLISEFGYNLGRLTLREKYTDTIQTLSSLPGIYKTFWQANRRRVLFTASQGQEGVYSVDLEGNQERLISFPPEYGISDMDTVDFNKDGITDIALVHGDNADYSNVAKAFHGIRVYYGDKDGGFSFQKFIAIPGATQVKWIDADRDGRQDIVATCYFAEEHTMSAILVNFTNDDCDHQSYRVSASANGRWLVMEKGDINQDGHPDLLLGSNIDGPTNDGQEQIQKWATSSVDILALISK